MRVKISTGLNQDFEKMHTAFHDIGIDEMLISHGTVSDDVVRIMAQAVE